jgi:hypothetical protein
MARLKRMTKALLSHPTRPVQRRRGDPASHLVHSPAACLAFVEWHALA